MNALPIWDAEQRLHAAPVPEPVPDHFAATEPLDRRTPEAAHVPGGHRGAAVAAAFGTVNPGADLPEIVGHLLAAVDAADSAAGIVRVDTNDAVLGQRIARIVSGSALPSRGPGNQARAILSLLTSHRAG